MYDSSTFTYFAGGYYNQIYLKTIFKFCTYKKSSVWLQYVRIKQPENNCTNVLKIL